MAVDPVDFTQHIGSHEEMKTIEEQLLRFLQSHRRHHHHHHQNQFDFKGFSVSSSKKALNRSGHARFRRGPSDPSGTTSSSSSSSQSEASAEIQVKPSPNTKLIESKKEISEECKSTSNPMSTGSSSITGEEGTVSNGKPVLPTAPRVYSSGKPPLPASHRKRSRDFEQASHGISGKQSVSCGCHCCSKRRKRVEIRRVRIKGGSSSSSSSSISIPSDEYSWKKYDQKLIPGTLFPRGYYKCNSVKGCPARKHVVRDQNDPTVLIVTYEGDHRHHRSMSDSLPRLNSSTVGIQVSPK